MDDPAESLDDFIEWVSRNQFWIGFVVGLCGTILIWTF